MKLFTFCLALLLSVFQLSAQEIEITPNKSESTDHYLSYSNSLLIRTYGIRKYTELKFIDDQQDDETIYSANDNFNLGVGFNYKWAGLNLAFNFPFINKDDEIYGKTKAFDLQGNFYGRKYLVDVVLQTYQGYYWKNPEGFRLNYNVEEMGYPTRKDLTTVNLSASVLKVFNHEEFSYRAAFVQNERQLHSAGSWLLGGYTSVFGINTQDSSFVLPREFIIRIKDRTLRVSEVRSFHLGVLGGYAHTFVIRKKWFASLALTLGAGFKSVERFIPSGESITTNRGGGYVSGRFAFGHNTDKHFYGITSIANTLNLQLEKTMKVDYIFGAVRFIYARRINMKK